MNSEEELLEFVKKSRYVDIWSLKNVKNPLIFKEIIENIKDKYSFFVKAIVWHHKDKEFIWNILKNLECTWGSIHHAIDKFPDDEELLMGILNKAAVWYDTGGDIPAALKKNVSKNVIYKLIENGEIFVNCLSAVDKYAVNDFELAEVIFKKSRNIKINNRKSWLPKKMILKRSELDKRRKNYKHGFNSGYWIGRSPYYDHSEESGLIMDIKNAPGDFPWYAYGRYAGARRGYQDYYNTRD